MAVAPNTADAMGTSLKMEPKNRVQEDPARAATESHENDPPSQAPMLRKLFQTAAGILVGSGLPVVSAASLDRCCALAVRGQFKAFEELPWTVCNYNQEIDYSTNTTYQSVTATMAWCMQNCGGSHISNLRQWVLPLSTYISPYVGMLLLCPTGDIKRLGHPKETKVRAKEDREGKEDNDSKGNKAIKETREKRLLRAVDWVRNLIEEYIFILGDPASAVFGACSEVWSDYRTTHEHSRDKPLSSTSWVVVLAGDLTFKPGTKWKNSSPPAEVHEQQRLLSSATEKITSGKDEIYCMTVPVPSPSATGRTTSVDDNIEFVITARVSFVKSILMPSLLMLAVTAATFYDAHSKLGEKDTALALAYCVWYSWLIVPSIVGNCFASALNPDLARQAFGAFLDTGGGDVLRVGLRDRYLNNRLWDCWNGRLADNPSGDSTVCEEDLNWAFWLRFAMGQFGGWICVAFASACAATISYQTPTVGLGCRSFNMVLYGILSLATAYLHLICSWMKRREKTSEHGKAIRGTTAITLLYYVLVFLNAMTTVLGTAFHVSGVFRRCTCERIGYTSSTLVELNSKTAQAVENAKKYWLSTSYIAFGVIWIPCMIAIVARVLISTRMRHWIESRKT